MSDASDEAVHDDADSDGDDVEALREEVEQKYDFEEFGPQEMAEMNPEEWEAAFDADTWITGEELLDRVEADVKRRVADRDVFARVERFDDMLIAYSDSGYAAVYSDGSIEGSGTVLRDVKPTVALCSMDSYEVPEMPEGETLPEPQEVPESSDALGNTVLQVVAAAQVVAGLVLLGAWLAYLTGLLSTPGPTNRSLNLWLLFVAGLGFLGIGVFLFVMVANARLSDKYRAEEFRNRLRAVGMEDGDRPDFLDDLDGEVPEKLQTAADESTNGAEEGTDDADEGVAGRGDDGEEDATTEGTQTDSSGSAT